jgi:dephospho-CoA kinase
MPVPGFSVGLTGGIGSGKSLVAEMFARLGATVVDTDAIAHSLTVPHGPAMPAIAAQFGPAAVAPDGSMDRVRMRELIFSDTSAKARLEAILHPMIRAAAEAGAAAATGPYVIFVVPLLVESGNWRERVDRIVVVDCPELLQVSRVKLRNNLSEEQVRAIMANQATRQQRLAVADDIVANDADMAALEPQIATLHQKYLAFSERMVTIHNNP